MKYSQSPEVIATPKFQVCICTSSSGERLYRI